MATSIKGKGTENSGESDEQIQVTEYLNNLTAAVSAVPPAMLSNLDMVVQAQPVDVVAITCGQEQLSATPEDFDCNSTDEPAKRSAARSRAEWSAITRGGGKGTAADGALMTDSANSLDLNLQTAGLAFQLRTRAPVSSQLVELTTRLEVALERLREMDGRLGSAVHRIGYLEAQLSEREREIERLQRQSQSQIPATRLQLPAPISASNDLLSATDCDE